MRHGSIVRIFKVQRIDSYNKTTSPSAKCSSEIWQISNFQAAKFNRNYRWLNMPTVDSTHGLFSWRSLAICIGLTSQEDNVCCSKKQCSPLGKNYLALLKSKISCQMLVSERNQKSSHTTSQCTQIWEKSLQVAKKKTATVNVFYTNTRVFRHPASILSWELGSCWCSARTASATWSLSGTCGWFRK